MRSKRFVFVPLLILGALGSHAVKADKTDLYRTIQARDADLWEAAQDIWRWAEPGYQETKSADRLADLLATSGFKVERGVADIPTAFLAEFGSGEPVIGILGEFDALPGLSQTASPQREERTDATYGHACGHHLFGVASAAAAIAIAERMEAGDLKGTIRYYGCPAEEGGGAKVFMVQAGLFKDCAAVLHWHPSSQNSAGDRSTLARIAVKFRFHGTSAHAAGAPEQGRSALDAVELTNHATQLLREHTPDQTRIHHVITAGGSAPNVVPDFAEVYYYVRHPKSEIVAPLYERLERCAQAGALATDTKLDISFQGGIKEIMPNNTLSRITMANLRELNDLTYDDHDKAFAIRLQQSLSVPRSLESIQQVMDQTGTVGMGSTDVGDVSWVVPTTGFTIACWVPGTPAHSWQAVACGANPIARKGMNLAARVLAATAWDLYQQPQVLTAAKQEHERRIGVTPYKSLMLPGQKPPLDYRDPPKR